MRKRWIVLTLCTLVLLVIGCAVGTATVRQEPEGTAYQLYFLERTLAEERAIDDTGCTAEETARLLLEALLRGPKDPLLESPFPKGTSLVSAERVGTELRVDLSAAYGGLSGVELSLADYAITLTLTQLPDVARVRITVLGEELDYRSRQVFLSRDVLLAPKEDVVSTVAVSLYFPVGDGVLTEEKRTLNLYEGDTQGGAVIRALENGPEAKGLQSALPEGFKVRKVWAEEGVCCVSLSSALLEGRPDPAALTLAIDALERSLLSLESVEEVRFLVDGEFADAYVPVPLP